MDITTLLINMAWFYLPAAVANMVPVLATKYKWTEFLNKPVDAGKTWGGKRILGDNKTLRGFILGTAAGTLVGFLQGHGVLLGFALSFGALAGDSIESIIKRQSGITPGKSLPVLDQIDYVLGASLAAALVIRVPAEYFILALVVLGIGSAFTSYVGYKLKIKKSI